MGYAIPHNPSPKRSTTGLRTIGKIGTQVVQDHPSRPSQKHYLGQGQKQKPAPAKGHPAVKAKGKGKKGRGGKDKGKQPEQTSPFQAGSKGFAAWSSMDASAFTPTTTLSTNPFASASASSSSLIAEKQEWIEALRKAYPGPSDMPEDTKRLVEKTEREYGRRGIKNLHQASTYLGKVKDHLGEVTDKRRAHRSLWMKHLANGIQVWEQQPEEYRKHQAFLAEEAGKARSEITSTSRIIQQLGHTAGGAAAPPPVTPVSGHGGRHRGSCGQRRGIHAQSYKQCLRNCAGSLGLDLDASKTVEIQDDGEGVEEQDKDKPTKRPGSLEPVGAGNGSGKSPTMWSIWFVTDLQPKLLVHGDHVRIAVPPSERFECPTVQLVGVDTGRSFTARTDGSCFTTWSCCWLLAKSFGRRRSARTCNYQLRN